jgi:hypothetical protein
VPKRINNMEDRIRVRVTRLLDHLAEKGKERQRGRVRF